MAFCFIGIDGAVLNCLHLVLFDIAGFKSQFCDFFVHPPLPSDILLQQ